MNHHDGNRNLKTLAFSLLLTGFAETTVGQEQPNPVFQANQFNTSVYPFDKTCTIDTRRMSLKDASFSRIRSEGCPLGLSQRRVRTFFKTKKQVRSAKSTQE
jgi:hypothetical protein